MVLRSSPFQRFGFRVLPAHISILLGFAVDYFAICFSGLPRQLPIYFCWTMVLRSSPFQLFGFRVLPPRVSIILGFRVNNFAICFSGLHPQLSIISVGGWSCAHLLFNVSGLGFSQFASLFYWGSPWTISRSVFRVYPVSFPVFLLDELGFSHHVSRSCWGSGLPPQLPIYFCWTMVLGSSPFQLVGFRENCWGLLLLGSTPTASHHFCWTMVLCEARAAGRSQPGTAQGPRSIDQGRRAKSKTCVTITLQP